MKTERLATHSSAVFMIVAWLLISALLVLEITVGIFTRTIAARALLGAFVLAWLLIPVQVVWYYRRKT